MKKDKVQVKKGNVQVKKNKNKAQINNDKSIIIKNNKVVDQFNLIAKITSDYLKNINEISEIMNDLHDDPQLLRHIELNKINVLTNKSLDLASELCHGGNREWYDGNDNINTINYKIDLVNEIGEVINSFMTDAYDIIDAINKSCNNDSLYDTLAEDLEKCKDTILKMINSFNACVKQDTKKNDNDNVNVSEKQDTKKNDTDNVNVCEKQDTNKNKARINENDDDDDDNDSEADDDDSEDDNDSEAEDDDDSEADNDNDDDNDIEADDNDSDADNDSEADDDDNVNKDFPNLSNKKINNLDIIWEIRKETLIKNSEINELIINV